MRKKDIALQAKTHLGMRVELSKLVRGNYEMRAVWGDGTKSKPITIRSHTTPRELQKALPIIKKSIMDERHTSKQIRNGGGKVVATAYYPKESPKQSLNPEHITSEVDSVSRPVLRAIPSTPIQSLIQVDNGASLLLDSDGLVWRLHFDEAGNKHYNLITR